MDRCATLGQARLLTGFACGLTALMCAGLLAGAALAQAPLAALVLIIPICVTLPMLAAWRATVTVASPGRPRAAQQGSAQRPSARSRAPTRNAPPPRFLASSAARSLYASIRRPP